ncbi:HD domain-containing phosphohydrolase [Paenibacillus thalictri]|uniref:HD domain-containing protein n=1 Tax=Paenibacillus thalictri TaxID=2527873 RepID=A0A4Q9DUK6_9BACL|nr:HD domain-containing phosphohydrolase [Paenibacillus thalictri]TBL80677.1 HD domain-containing protein [Paenibacillus thalictri]
MIEPLRPFLQLSDAVVITDCRHVILEVNAAYQRVTGYNREEVIGRAAGLLRTKHTPLRSFQKMKESLSRGKAWSGIFVNRKKSNDIWHSSITITPFLIGDQTYYVGVFRELEQLNEGVYIDEDGKDRLQGALLKMLAMSCEIRDPGIEQHLMRVQRWTEQLVYAHNQRCGLKLTTDYMQAITHASILHDIGKSGIPEGILYKPGPLASYERMIINTHPQIGADILAKVTGEMNESWLAQDWATAHNIILHHHEKWNGTGYPYGLAKEQIPLEARIVTVLDVYDALVSRRPYKDMWTENDALAYVVSEAGISFDPDIVETFAGLQLE